MGADSALLGAGAGAVAAPFGAAGGALLLSDRRLKRDIFQLGELASGIPIYVFRFEGFEDWHIGVMADEVMGVIPHAVLEDESGYKKVHYNLLH